MLVLWLRDACCLKFIAKPHLFATLLLLAGCDAGQAPDKVNAQDMVPSDPTAMTLLQRAEAGQMMWG